MKKKLMKFYSVVTIIVMSIFLFNTQCNKEATNLDVAIPIIASFTPTEAAVGSIVTITGNNFSITPANNIVTFLGANSARIRSSVTASTATSITTTVPAEAVTGKIWVQVGDSIAKATTIFTIKVVPLSIISFAPAGAMVGETVTITGTKFSTTLADNKVTFLGAASARIAATVTAATSTSITTTVPANTITGKIWVQVGDSTAKAENVFTVIPPPTPATPSITSFTPTIGFIGATVTITGTNFSTTLADNKVTFLGAASARIAATVTAATATSITITVPTGAITGKIWVEVGTTGIGKASTDFFVPPTITSFTPPNALVGATVTITGTNFSIIAADNKVTFLGAASARIPATVTAATTTSITTTVPANAITGKIWVQVGDSIAKASTAFTVDVAPSITYTNTIKSKLSNTCTSCHSGYGTNYAVDVANAGSYNTRIQNGSMPQNGAWTAADKSLMQQWIDAGKPE